MPLPFILAGAAIAAAGVGAKKAYDGYQKSSEADELMSDAEWEYDEAKEKFDAADKKLTSDLEALGKLQLKVGSDFAEFNLLAKSLLEKLNQTKDSKEINVTLPEHRLNEIAEFSMSATAYLGQLAGAGAVGAAAAYAVYGGVMALAAASTGTPIAALSGAAAYNATMAAIGGGSLAAGGFGMAGGAAILSATVAAPVLAVAGWAYDRHAEKKLENAKEYEREAKKAIKSLEKAKEKLEKTDSYVVRIHSTTESIYQVFSKYFSDLKSVDALIRNGADISTFEAALLHIINNGYQVAAILTDIITTPLFKVKKDESGNVILDKENKIEIETDSDGMQVLNEEEIDLNLNTAKFSVENFK